MGDRTKRCILAALGALLLAAGLAPWCIRALPALSGQAVYIVSSGSMEPEYPVGCCVRVEPADPAGIAPGEVAAFRTWQGTVLHRVTDNDTLAGVLRTKGDANELEDANAVAYGDVLGVAAGKMPCALFAAAWTSGNAGCLTLCAAGSGLMLVVMAATAPRDGNNKTKGAAKWRSAGYRARSAAQK